MGFVNTDRTARCLTARRGVLALCVAFAALMMMLVLAAPCTRAFAADASFVDGAGNTFSSSSSIPSNVKRDLYWAGQDLKASNATIGSDAILAGYDLTLTDSKIGGDIRSGSYSLTLKGTTVEGNITSAGYSLDVDKDSSAAAVYFAGEQATFSGTCDALAIAASDVIIAGTINGDVTIMATNVTFSSTAKVTGAVKVVADNEPVIRSGAQVDDLEYVKSSNDEVKDAFSVASPLLGLMSLLFLIPAFIILALFLAWVAPGPVEKSGNMIARRPLPMVLSGILGLILLPIVIVILCILVVTLPVAGLLMLLINVLLLCCVPFAGASVAHIVMPKMNRFGSAALGAAVFSALLAVPVVKWIIFIACYAYSLGYFIQAIWFTISKKKTSPQPGANMPGASIPGANDNPFGQQQPPIPPIPPTAG